MFRYIAIALLLVGCGEAAKWGPLGDAYNVVSACPDHSARTPGEDFRNCYCDCGYQVNPDGGACWWNGGNADAPPQNPCHHGQH